MKKNKVVWISGLSDMGIAWSALVFHYMRNKEQYDRFPAEIIVNWAMFSPILMEANCRASFKSPHSFGEGVQYAEVFASRTLRAKRLMKKGSGLAFKGALSTMGLVGLTYGFDELFLLMGGELTSSSSLKQALTTLPFIYLHTGMWSTVKSLTFSNPIRHKFFPALSRKIARKMGWPIGAAAPVRLGIDAMFYFNYSKYNAWEFLDLYRATLMPKLMAVFGLGAAGLTQVEVVDEELIETDEEMSVTRTLSNGVKTRTVATKSESGGYRLSDIEVDMPDDVLDELVEVAFQEELFKYIEKDPAAFVEGEDFVILED